jgi:hypothetical protein
MVRELDGIGWRDNMRTYKVYYSMEVSYEDDEEGDEKAAMEYAEELSRVERGERVVFEGVEKMPPGVGFDKRLFTQKIKELRDMITQIRLWYDRYIVRAVLIKFIMDDKVVVDDVMELLDDAGKVL